MCTDLLVIINSFIGVIVGATVSIATTLISNKKDLRLKKMSISFERKEKARSFQRETLLVVQESIQKSIRYMAEAYNYDKSQYKKTNVWHKCPLNDELDKNIFQTNKVLTLHVERVSNDILRSAIKDLQTLITDCTIAVNSEKADTTFNDATIVYTNVMEEIGKVLRELY